MALCLRQDLLSPMQSPGRLMDEIRTSRAFAIESRFGVLGQNYYVFEKNYRVLKAFLTEMQTAEHILRYASKDETLFELTRLLHNFLASAKMLVDLTRNVMRDWYSETSLHSEYREEVRARVSSSMVAGFMEDLRNFALHFELPITAAHVQITRDPATGTYTEYAAFTLQKSTLLKWRGWSKGKLYLQKSDEDIHIESLVDQYFQAIQGLHQWISQRLAQEHASDLEWLERKRVELEQVLRQAGITTPPKK